MFPTPPTPPQAPPPTSRGGGAQQAERVRAMLLDVLMRAKQMAEQNGIDFAEIVSQVVGQGKGAAPTEPMMG